MENELIYTVILMSQHHDGLYVLGSKAMNTIELNRLISAGCVALPRSPKCPRLIKLILNDRD